MRATRPALRDLTKRMERHLDNTFLPLTQQSSSSSDQHVCGVMCGGQFSVCCVLSENDMITVRECSTSAILLFASRGGGWCIDNRTSYPVLSSQFMWQLRLICCAESHLYPCWEQNRTEHCCFSTCQFRYPVIPATLLHGLTHGLRV